MKKTDIQTWAQCLKIAEKVAYILKYLMQLGHFDLDSTYLVVETPSARWNESKAQSVGTSMYTEIRNVLSKIYRIYFQILTMLASIGTTDNWSRGSSSNRNGK